MGSLARLIGVLAVLAVAGPTAAADRYVMGQTASGYSGYGLGGGLYLNALPIDAEVRLDGVPIGRANDLAASIVDARVGPHQVSVSAPGYEPATALVQVLREWTTRVRLTLIPAR